MKRPDFRQWRGLLVAGLAALCVSCSGMDEKSMSMDKGMGGMLPAGLTEMLGKVSELGGSVGEWKASLNGMLDSAGLGQLRQYVDQAGEYADKLMGMKESVSGMMADPLGAIGSKLQEMAGLDVDALKGMGAGDQMDAVNGFADSASSVSTMADDFLAKFGG
ncbi:MAG: hypothetical protein KDC38_10305 [Planctomycetes bacterium]|nr:hypothetical protein [Planctomycetota bacterium]